MGTLWGPALLSTLAPSGSICNLGTVRHQPPWSMNLPSCFHALPHAAFSFPFSLAKASQLECHFCWKPALKAARFVSSLHSACSMSSHGSYAGFLRGPRSYTSPTQRKGPMHPGQGELIEDGVTATENIPPTRTFTMSIISAKPPLELLLCAGHRFGTQLPRGACRWGGDTGSTESYHSGSNATGRWCGILG